MNRINTLLRLVLGLGLCFRTRTGGIGTAWDDLYPNTVESEDGMGLGGWRGEHVISSIEEMNLALNKYNDTGLFLEFFLPWCGHSRRLRPEFRRAAAISAGKPVFARIDCSSPGGARVCVQFDVQYHPHMLLIHGGKSYEYTQRATATEIAKYCHRVLGPHVLPIKALGEFVELLEEEQVVVVALLEEDGKIPTFFSEAARLIKDQVRFVSLKGPVFAEALGLASQGQTLVVVRLQQHSVVWSAQVDSDSEKASEPRGDAPSEAAQFAEWVAEHHVKLVETITQENFQKKLGSGLPAMLLFRDDSAASDSVQRALYKTAAHFKGVLNVCSVNGARYQKLAVKLGVNPHTIPAVVIVDVANQTQFVFPPAAPLVQDRVFAFASRVLAGEEACTLRSALAPAYQEGPVYTLVADRFGAAVLDPAKDVVVHFHAKWCGFCNLFAPTYTQLALHLANVDTVAFYDFDCSDNDPDPSLNISAFPTVMLFSSHNKTAVTYMGDRSVPLMAKFIQQHVGNKMEMMPDGVMTDTLTALRIRTAIENVKNSISHT